jgi:hypothetical protein
LIIEKAPVNPYAPPQAALDTTPGLGCARDGKVLIVPAGEGLPARCVKCNQPAIMDKPRTFTWHSPGWYLLILLAVLIYVIVGMIVRKKVRLAIGLCEAHRARRRTLNLTGAGLFVAGLGALFAGIHFDVEALGWIGALALLASVIVALFAASGLSVARIDDGQARFRGCGKAFLDSLPQG